MRTVLTAVRVCPCGAEHDSHPKFAVDTWLSEEHRNCPVPRYEGGRYACKCGKRWEWGGDGWSLLPAVRV